MKRPKKDRRGDWSASQVSKSNDLSRWPDIKIKTPPNSQPAVRTNTKKMFSDTEGDNKDFDGFASDNQKQPKDNLNRAQKPKKGFSLSDDENEDEGSSSSDNSTDDSEQAKTPLSIHDIVKKVRAKRQKKAGYKQANKDDNQPSARKSLEVLEAENEAVSESESVSSTATHEEESPSIRSPTPTTLSSPAKAKLKDAIASKVKGSSKPHTTGKQNVLNARTPTQPLARMKPTSPATDIPEKPKSTLRKIKSSKDLDPGKANTAPKLRTERSNAPAPSSSPITEKAKANKVKKKKSSLPADATIIKAPQVLDTLPPLPGHGPETKDAEEERKAIYDRIKHTYGEPFAKRNLTIQPIPKFQTYSSKAFVKESESEDELPESNKQKKSKTISTSKGDAEMRAERRLKKAEEAKKEGKPDDVLVAARDAAAKLVEYEKRTEEQKAKKWAEKDRSRELSKIAKLGAKEHATIGRPKHDERTQADTALSTSNGPKFKEVEKKSSKKRRLDNKETASADEADGRDSVRSTKKLKKGSDSCQESSSQDTRKDSSKNAKKTKQDAKKMSQDLSDTDGVRPRKKKRNNSSDPEQSGDDIESDNALLAPLQEILSSQALDSAVTSLNTKEEARITAKIEKKRRKEQKKLVKGKIKNNIWENVDAESAIQNDLIKSRVYTRDDAEVIINAARSTVKSLSGRNLAKTVTAEVNVEQGTGNSRSTGNMTELEIELSRVLMQRDIEKEHLEGQVRNLKAQVQRLRDVEDSD